MHKKGLENRIRLFDERQCQATSLRLFLPSSLQSCCAEFNGELSFAHLQAQLAERCENYRREIGRVGTRLTTALEP